VRPPRCGSFGARQFAEKNHSGAPAEKEFKRHVRVGAGRARLRSALWTMRGPLVRTRLPQPWRPKLRKMGHHDHRGPRLELVDQRARPSRVFERLDDHLGFLPNGTCRRKNDAEIGDAAVPGWPGHMGYYGTGADCGLLSEFLRRGETLLGNTEGEPPDRACVPSSCGVLSGMIGGKRATARPASDKW